jgi:hypothetical protein
MHTIETTTAEPKRFTPEEIETILEQADVGSRCIFPLEDHDLEDWREGLANYDRNSDEVHVIGWDYGNCDRCLMLKKGYGIWWEEITEEKLSFNMKDAAEEVSS